jgi:XTP/dITP diphosphohydrolase
MSKRITITTTNAGKFQELKRYINYFNPDIIVEQEILDIPEYQDMDIKRVALGKAQYAWNILQKPLLIDDGGIYIEKYNQFPGVFSKYVFEGIGLEGIWKLAQEDPRTYFLNCLVYISGPQAYEFFEGKTHGTLIAPKITAHKTLPYRSIFIPKGFNKTLEELWSSKTDQSYNHRYKAIEKFVAWYNRLL